MARVIYVPTFDMLAVLDANKLISGQDPLITNIGAFRFPYQVTVSPVAINPAQLQVTTASLPSGTQYFAYSASLAASGGVPPYTWKIISGSLPTGLTLSATGEITGTPTASGPANFTVQVTDSQMHQASAQLSINILPPPVLQITTTSLPAGPQGQAYYAVLGATGGVPPYSWSITAGSLPTGLNPLSSNGVISGTPTKQGTYPFTVQVADSQQPPVKVTQPLSITINASGNTALLQGTYAFLLNVFTQTAGQAAYLGSFVADGNGNITSGVVDFNGVTGGPLNSTVTGTYSMASTGIGTIILNISGAPQLTLAFDLSSSGNGRIIEYDDTNGQGNRGSGVIRKQDTSAFSLSKMTGTYAYGLGGADQGGKRIATAGEFFTDGAGNVTNGLADINDNGTMTSVTFTGTLSNMDPNSGRVALKINSSLGPSDAAIYVVTSTEFLYIATDSVKNTGIPLFSGTQLRQTGAGSFNNGSLNGISIVYDQDLDPNGGIAEAQVAFFTANGVGNWTYTYDQNREGVISQGSDQGQYSVSSNGRATLGGQSPIFYLVNQNQAFFVVQDSKV